MGTIPIGKARCRLERAVRGISLDRARGGLMVRNFDSYAYACGFESGLDSIVRSIQWILKASNTRRNNGDIN